MIKVAVVEDENRYADTLSAYLARFEEERDEQVSVKRFTDGDEIAENYRAEFDIILMDIQMRFMDGMTAAEKIRELDSEVIIIFITNMTSYAIRGYAVSAFDYILKPIEYFSFSQKFGRAVERLNSRVKRYISVPMGSGVRKLDVDNVAYVESNGHKLFYKLSDGVEVESRGVMNEVEKTLDPFGFFRINKGFIVNLRYIYAVSGGYCRIGDEEISISRQKKQEFMSALTRYIGKSVA